MYHLGVAVDVLADGNGARRVAERLQDLVVYESYMTEYSRI